METIKELKFIKAMVLDGNSYSIGDVVPLTSDLMTKEWYNELVHDRDDLTIGAKSVELTLSDDTIIDTLGASDSDFYACLSNSYNRLVEYEVKDYVDNSSGGAPSGLSAHPKFTENVITFDSSWYAGTNAVSSTCRLFVDALGKCHLLGAFVGTSSQSGVLGTLPEDYRPIEDMEFNCVIDGTGSSIICVRSSGDIELKNNWATTISVNGVEFSLDSTPFSASVLGSIPVHPEFTNGWVSGSQYITADFSELVPIFYRINEVGEVFWKGKLMNSVTMNNTGWYDCFENLPTYLIPENPQMSLEISYYENAENKIFSCNFGYYANRSAMSIHAPRITQAVSNARINLSQVSYLCSVEKGLSSIKQYCTVHSEFTDGVVSGSSMFNSNVSDFDVTYQINETGEFSLNGVGWVSNPLNDGSTIIVGSTPFNPSTNQRALEVCYDNSKTFGSLLEIDTSGVITLKNISGEQIPFFTFVNFGQIRFQL